MEINWVEIIILLASGYICVVVYIKWIFNYWKRRNVPYLKPSIPMGNFEAPWAIKKGVHQTMQDIYWEFKTKGYKHCGIFSALRSIYVPLDLDILKKIMIQDFQHFVDRGLYVNEKTDPIGAHLFRINGDKWRNLRIRLSPTFTSGKMKAMFHLVLSCGAELEDEINKLWQTNKPVNMKEITTSFTTNVIGTCIFGLDCNCFADPKNEFRYYIKRFFDGGICRIIRNTITFSFPNLSTVLGIRALPEEATKFFSEVIRNLVDYRETNNVSRNDFVQLLLNMKNGDKKNEVTITFEEIAAQAFVFFVAGVETSSSTMTFAFYEMAKNQDIQDKIRREIREVLEKHGGKLTYDAINEMTYMSQVFDETLRKYPIMPTLERICTKDYEVPGENLVLKKGQKVMISLIGIQNDPEYYPNPEKFDPERFTPENKAARHPCAYMPFGEGPRICIGMRFGIMQAKIGMAILLKDYKYILNAKEDDLKFSSKALLLSPMGEVLLDIEKVD